MAESHPESRGKHWIFDRFDVACLLPNYGGFALAGAQPAK